MPHGHALGLGLYILSWVIIGKYAADVIAGGFAHSTAARALHQGV
jgi:hypothetical protein